MVFGEYTLSRAELYIGF